MLSHARVIQALGGGTVIAVELTADLNQPVHREAIYKWRERGAIPARYWPAVARLAKSRSIEGVTVETLEAA